MSHDLPYNPEYPNLVCLACGERRDTPICRVARILELEKENAKLRQSIEEFLGWYNKTYQQAPSMHPDHPYNKAAAGLQEDGEKNYWENVLDEEALDNPAEQEDGE